MKKSLFLGLVVVQLLVFCAPSLSQADNPSDYEKYYRQFMDSKESLSYIYEKDSATLTYKPLTQLLDSKTKAMTDIAYGSDPAQKLDIYRWKDNQKRPVIFYIHGGGWVAGDKNGDPALAIAGKEWLSMGYMLVSINYRLALLPKADPAAATRDLYQLLADTPDPSTRYAHAAQIEDCGKALKWVIDNIEQYGGDPNRIAISGQSAGGHLAALLTVNTGIHSKYGIDAGKIKFGIPVAGVYDFSLPENYSQPWMPAFMKALLDDPGNTADAAPITHVTGNEPPLLIIHGSDDWILPRTNAYSFYNKLKEKGANKAELEVLKGYWHDSTLTRYNQPGDKAARVINRFLAAYLPAKGNRVGGKPLDISVRLNSATLSFCDARPFIGADGILMAPSTFVTEDIGAFMQRHSPNVYKIILGNKVANVNESMLVKKGKTIFVPVKYIAEALGAKMEWMPDTRTAVVSFK